MSKNLEAELVASVLRDRDHASAEANRVAQLRDELDVRLRLGLVAFNAASLVALLSAIGAAPAFLEAIGFTRGLSIFALVAFALGAIAAGVSAFSTQNDLTRRSGASGARVSAIQARLSALSMNNGLAFEEYSKRDLQLFEEGLSRPAVARWGQYAAAGAWLAGVLAPFSSLVFG